MSVAQGAAKASPLRRSPQIAIGAGTEVNRLPVYISCTLLALIVNYLLGKDTAWDAVNYQFYAGFSAVNDRFAQDYFAAGPQSYFNPYAYVPFYALVKAGLSPLEISSALAISHSCVLWLTFELAVSVCPSHKRSTSMTYGICAIALATVNPILIQQIGSSYADITTAVLVLGGWLLLVRAVGKPRAALVVCAGLLLGAATALKLTNSVHAVAGSTLLILLPRTVFSRVRYGLGYVVAAGLGFALAAASWSYRLDRMFGNPLFPLMNGVFRSPEFTTEPLRHFRFIPDNFADALWRPFEIADPVPMVQTELAAPDLRYAVLVVLLGVILIRLLWNRSAQAATPTTHSELTVATRALAALGCGLATDWVLWLSASGNGRYFVPMASVAGVMIVALLFRQSATRPKLRNYVLAIVFGAQVVQLYVGANSRGGPLSWRQQWFEVEVPEKLATERALYLTVGVQSNSFLAPFLARDAGLINFSGGYALGPDGTNGRRINELIHQYAPHLRVLWRIAQPPADDEAYERVHSSVDDPLSRFGLRVDTSDCATIILHGPPFEPDIEFTSSEPEQKVRDASFLAACHVVPDNADRSAQIARERAVDLVLDRVEDACPKLFQPRRLRTEQNREIWRRLYMNTDLVALVSHGWVGFLNPIRGGPMVYLGRESDWARAPLQLACGRRNGRYFARVLELTKAP